MTYRQATVQCLTASGLHRMAYTEWGDPDNPDVLLCVHGLTRNGRDFDTLAEALSAHYRVVCPDIVGRGLSSHLADPAGYGIPQYLADLLVLIARLKVDQVDWLGTSMGGLIGMTLAALPGAPIRRLALNDIGPVITAAGLQRIAAYVGALPVWATLPEALETVERLSAGFGPMTAEQRRHLALCSIKQREDGRWVYRYDPAIAAIFRTAVSAEPIDLWSLYDRIACPTLAIRGAESDILDREIWQSMGTRGPQARCVEFAGTGHAPMFQDEEQIEAIRAFLLAP